MFNQGTRSAQRFITLVAGVQFIASVSSFVLNEVTRFAKWFATHLAAVWFLTNVSSFVLS